ncbi:MAG: hypothetical protein VKK80_11645 [Prochlorothrix sp.]|nr:hypothetical protein [Prochlorothrix sp.]
MAYSDFKTLEQINQELGIQIKSGYELYQQVEPVQLTPWFTETMKLAYTKAVRINTESARQALIVDNVLLELSQHSVISFFLENSFNVDQARGLTGNPDGLISKSENQLYITDPVVVLVEAKKSDLGSGLPQCIAGMEAARVFNEKKGNPVSPIYGVVTDGVLWQFLALEGGVATIDSYFYALEDGSRVIGILKFLVESSGLIEG